MLAGLTGDAHEMDINLGKALRLADELRSPVFRLWTAELVVHYKTAFGEWDSALEIAERTIADGRVLGIQCANGARTRRKKIRDGREPQSAEILRCSDERA